MPKATDITIRDVRCFFEPIQFRSPLKFGGRVMDKACLINVEVRVETPVKLSKKQKELLRAFDAESAGTQPETENFFARMKEFLSGGAQ